MTKNIRRVVTGHDEAGKAVVKFDDIGVNRASGRPVQYRQLIWTTEELPVQFEAKPDDLGDRDIATTIPGGSVFRAV
jgi:hypothetical protein